MTSAPEKIPPTPIPAIALPRINTRLEGEIAHMKEPISNIAIAVRKITLTCERRIQGIIQLNWVI
jgi:hypothetical protein